MSKPKSKQVPLVLYKGGKRIELGMAIIYEDGKIEAQIAKDARAYVNGLIENSIGNISINPPDVKPQFPYNKVQET